MDSGAQRGFTLYELLIGVLIAGIVLGIGVPSLVDFSRNSRIVATANEFVSAVHLARGEAVTRKQGLTLCLSANPVAAVPVCTTDGSVTAGGYFVWVDSDADAVADNDEQILQQRAVPADVSFHSDSGFVHFGTRPHVVDT
jgi:type IV fimbrial biogenesis protein FimT